MNIQPGLEKQYRIYSIKRRASNKRRVSTVES